MCLAIPAKVIKIENKIAEVEVGKVYRKADLHLLENVEIGDYILIHAGFAIEKISQKDAKETLDIIRDIL